MAFNVYLDIDGVLLANDKYIANFSKEFLKYITDNHHVYWLTTHVHGNTEWVYEYLSRFFDADAMESIKKINVTDKDWDVAKTEAIDFTQPFLWIDDDCYPEEHDDLINCGVLDNWVKIDLAKDVDQLETLLNNFPEPITP